MIDIFEKSLIYLAEHPPGYPLPSQDKTRQDKTRQIRKTKKRPAQQGASTLSINQ